MNASHGHPAHNRRHPRRDAGSELVRAKKVDLASSLGAGVIGGGLGVLVARYVDVGPTAIALIVVGIGLHGWAMFERRRLEALAPRVWWTKGSTGCAGSSSRSSPCSPSLTGSAHIP